MDTTSRKRGTTVTRRIEIAADCCRRIELLPVGLTTAQHLITTTAMPGALFGCESAPVNAAAARKLRTAVNNALLGGNYSSGAPEIALQGSSRHTLDPELRILELRLLAARRAILKNTRRGHDT